jgi:hypothetical protein
MQNSFFSHDRELQYANFKRYPICQHAFFQCSPSHTTGEFRLIDNPRGRAMTSFTAILFCSKPIWPIRTAVHVVITLDVNQPPVSPHRLALNCANKPRVVALLKGLTWVSENYWRAGVSSSTFHGLILFIACCLLLLRSMKLPRSMVVFRCGRRE